ncbi:unnamed protein product [Diabrotica balteata]|uniref:Uncharacterized protein n=1 Tax=Diabrotica balteata TaxID=107213 RepID=A0A9N9T6D2_DIABA|nr:unnamed protein product [Diabrotica balteata]
MKNLFNLPRFLKSKRNLDSTSEEPMYISGNQDSTAWTAVEIEASVNETLLDSQIEVQTNLVPEYDSDGFSYEDEIDNAKTVEEITTATTSRNSCKRSCLTNSPITISPMYTDESDFDDDEGDPTFNFENKICTNTNGQNVNWNDIKQLKVSKDDPITFKYKTSYEDEVFKEVNMRNKRRKMTPLSEILLKKAYTSKKELSANKKKDMKELVTKGLIPLYYANFYNSIL